MQKEHTPSKLRSSTAHSVPVIKPEELKLESIVGEGQYGLVYKGKCRDTAVAVKVLNNREWDDAVIHAFSKEVEIMSKLNHPNVVTLLGACTEDRQSLCIVTELLEVDLRTVLHNHEIQLSNLQKFNFAIDVAQGMVWLHNAKPHPIIHRDLKPSNLLLDANWRVKVCDFGLSTILPGNDFLQDKNHAVGSAIWMAPEVLMGKLLSDKLDVYSFALILWEIWIRREPYGEYKTVEELRNATCKQGLRPSTKKGIPGPLITIMERSWTQTASQRPSFVEILDLLKEALVAIEIGSNRPRAIQLWSIHWPGVSEIHWSALQKELAREMNLDIQEYEIEFKCLETLVAQEKKKGSDTTPIVNIHRFGLVLSWFGPMENHTWEHSDVTFLTRIASIMARPWFFGDIERTEAEDLLLSVKRKKGTFLVRLNLGGSEEPSVSPFIISKVNKEQKVEHIRVYPNSTGWHIHTKNKSSSGKTTTGNESIQGDFEALIKRLKSKDIIGDALPSQKYKKIFESVEGAIMYFGKSSMSTEASSKERN